MLQLRPFVAAVDVGYSAVKAVFGLQGSEPETQTLPAGAAPVEFMAESVSRHAPDYLTVQIEGKPWAAGVEPSRLDGYARELHADYPASLPYRALFFAACLVSGSDRIDTLVTGLPVAQAKDPARVKALRDRLKGRHQITPRRAVEVSEVQILPQPVGAWLDYLNQPDADPEALENARALVIDPGFFSVDWVVIEDGELRNNQAGTSTAAMSQLIEEADKAIAHEHGASVGRDKIEKALRTGAGFVTLYGQRVTLAPFIAKAGQYVAGQALAAMRQNLRTDARPFDVVLLTGGGARTYAAAAREIFPKARILTPAEPVLANARGFWSFGQ